MSDLTTLQWARLLDRQERVVVVTSSRVVDGRLRAVGASHIEFRKTSGHKWPATIARRHVRRVYRHDAPGWRRVRPRGARP